MHEHMKVFTAVGLGLGLAMALVQGAVAQENPVTAIDIALEPDATMVEHAMAANARLLKSFPKGFSLDEDLAWIRRVRSGVGSAAGRRRGRRARELRRAAGRSA